jgi:hypothetical protein
VTASDAPATPRLEISTSRQMLAWLPEHRVSLAFSTYQIGKLFLIGLKPDGGISLFERSRGDGISTTGR